MINRNDHAVDFVDDYLHDVLEPADAQWVEQHCERCKICAAALEEAQARYDLLQSVPTCEASEQLVQATVARLDHTVTRKNQRWRTFRKTFQWVTAACVIGIAAVHAYFYQLRPNPIDLQLFGQKQWQSGSLVSLRLGLFDREQPANNQAMTGIPVTITLFNPVSQERVELASFQWSPGMATPRFRVPGWDDGQYELELRASVAGRVETLRESIQLKRDWKVMISTDKPVYQPGQVLHVRALALQQPALKPSAGEEVTFEVSDPKGNRIFRQRTLTSRFGISSFDLPLAAEILHGEYRIRCLVADVASERTVKVEPYVLPKFKAELPLDQPFYAPGSTLEGTISAKYFFGKPVSAGEAKIQVFEISGVPRVLNDTTIQLDAEGQGAFRVRLPQQLVGSPQLNGDAEIEVIATITDTAGQVEAVRVKRVVTSQPIRLAVLPESSQLVRGVANRVYLYAYYADGRPVADARVIISGTPSERTTNALGVCLFEAPGESSERTIRVIDQQGRERVSRVSLRTSHLDGDFIVRPEKAVYRSGDSLKLSFLTSSGLADSKEPILIDLIKDGQTILTDSVEVSGGQADWVTDLPADVFGTLRVVAYRYGRAGFVNRHSRVIFVEQPRAIQLQTKLDATEYAPGERARLRVELKDPDGKPVVGAISLAGVDEAVFSVLSQATGLEEVFFLLEKELLKPVLTLYPWSPATLWADSDASFEDLENAVFCATADDRAAKQLYSLNPSTYVGKVERCRHLRNTGLRSAIVAWIGLACGVALTGVVVFVIAFPRLSLLLGAALGLIAFGATGMFLMTSPLQRAMATAEMEMMPMDAAAGMEMPNASLAVPKTASGAAPPRVRSWFPETLLWIPELITDDQGVAELEIPLADSITTWRFNASAVTAEGQLGTTQFPLKVFQSFFVDVNLPTSFTRHDEVDVPIVVYNYAQTAQSVSLRIKPDDWFEIRSQESDQEQAAWTVDLQAGEVKSVKIPLRFLRVGQFQLQVTATADSVADAIRRDVNVTPNGRRVEVSFSGMVDPQRPLQFEVDPGCIDGSLRTILRYYPTQFSQVVEGLDQIFRLPYGCFEQTSSTTYPNVLALDYLKKTQTSSPQIEAKARQYINLGYQRLVSFEVEGGGFDWFGRPPANETLTAYGLLEFQDMAEVYDVDPQLIKRTQAWLLSKRKPDGSWTADPSMLNDGLAASVLRGDNLDYATTAYIAWAVFNQGDVNDQASMTLNYLRSVAPSEFNDPYVLAIAVNAMYAIAPTDRQNEPYVEALLALKQSDDKFTWWQKKEASRTLFHGSGGSSSVETTSAAILALLRSGRHSSDAQRAVLWLIEQKDPSGIWHTTQATVLALKAILASSGDSGRSVDRRVVAQINGVEIDNRVIPQDQADVIQRLDLTDSTVLGDNLITLNELTDTMTGFQLTAVYYVDTNDTDERAAEDDPFSIHVAYDQTRLNVDDTITATARVENHTQRPSPMIMVDLPIPAGFALEADELIELQGSGKIAKYQLTPTQAILYLRQLKAGESLSLRYRLRATMPVKVAGGQATVYEYYNPDRRSDTTTAALVVAEAP